MIRHANEITAIEDLGYTVLYVGKSRPLCNKCGKRAIVYETENMVCHKKHEGCSSTFDYGKDLQRMELTRIPLWRVGKSIDGTDTMVYVGEEVLERLPKLTREQLHDWYMQWDDAAIIDTLAKADLPDELSKIENSVLMPPEPKKKRERIGGISI